MGEKSVCPHCRFYGDALEERMNKKQAAQICPRCGNLIRVIYKPKGKGTTEERK